MFTKLLIANRGEIACRIIRTARRMGIKTVAVYSSADRNAQHVKLADESIFIGPAPTNESYLVLDKIIAAAKTTGAQAIHPGYGFLSENEQFAEACAKNNIVFVGPPINAIAAMGSKSAAKAIMGEADVPLVPGYHGQEQAPDILRQHADSMDYPVLLKAAYGGGGKGMRAVHKAAEFDEALAAAKREAKASFGDDRMLIEKLIQQPRHVEIQVFMDEHGNGVYLAERDCSVQRRHQKVIEEAPAPALSSSTRQAMGEAAVRAAAAIDYVGAGTVEFLLDRDSRFYFMEMNTRLQVEHPVTEMITGVDLVEWQLRVAAGEPLPLAQDDIQIHGHAFEARIYAEDPANNFLPSTGTLKHLRAPEVTNTVRIDTGVVEGDEVSSYYDPMIAKLIVWGEDRSQALNSLMNALDDYRIAGLHTNIDFLRRIGRHSKFQQAELNTQFIERYEDDLFAPIEMADDDALTIATLVLHDKPSCNANPWHTVTGFRVNEQPLITARLALPNADYQTTALRHCTEGWFRPEQPETVWLIESRDEHSYSLSKNGHRQTIHAFVDEHKVTLFTVSGTVAFERERIADTLLETQAQGSLTAPMNGTIVDVLVKAGEVVDIDQAVMIMEAMKMEYTIRAPKAGTVTDVFYQAGELVSDGAELAAIDSDEEA